MQHTESNILLNNSFSFLICYFLAHTHHLRVYKNTRHQPFGWLKMSKSRRMLMKRWCYHKSWAGSQLLWPKCQTRHKMGKIFRRFCSSAIHMYCHLNPPHVVDSHRLIFVLTSASFSTVTFPQRGLCENRMQITLCVNSRVVTTSQVLGHRLANANWR